MTVDQTITKEVGVVIGSIDDNLRLKVSSKGHGIYLQSIVSITIPLLNKILAIIGERHILVKMEDVVKPWFIPELEKRGVANLIFANKKLGTTQVISEDLVSLQGMLDVGKVVIES